MRISDWSSDVCSSDLIEDEIARTFKRSVAGRRVVDVKDAAGPGLAGVGTGHMRAIAAPQKGVGAKVREVRALVELTVPFELQRDAIDDVERGANDSDWQPAKDAAIELAYAEDRAIFDGYKARSEEHTSELQSLMRNSYAVF